MKLSVSAYRASYNLSEQRILAGPVPTYGSTNAPGHEGSTNVPPTPALQPRVEGHDHPDASTMTLPQLQLEGQDMAQASSTTSPVQPSASPPSEIILNPTAAAVHLSTPAEVRIPNTPGTRRVGQMRAESSSVIRSCDVTMSCARHHWHQLRYAMLWFRLFRKKRRPLRSAASSMDIDEECIPHRLLSTCSRSHSVGERQWTRVRAVMAWYTRLRRIKRTRSNQRWMKLRTTVQLTGAIASSVQSKKSSLKREDSFITRFSTRQIPEVQETFDTGDETDGLDRPKKKRRKKRGTVINPDGNVLFYWLFVLTGCVLYNLWTVIVRQAFPELYTTAPVFWICTDGFSDVVFLLDVVVQFRTGYLEQGLIVAESRKLAVHYVKSQAFLLDMFSLIPLDWLIPRDIRWRPLLRFVRFTKVYRMYHYYYMVESRTIFPNMWRVLNLVHILLLLAHWFGCFYYLLSEAEGFRSDWSYPPPEGDFGTLTRKYLGSLYWSTLTLTTIGDLPTPETNAEYVFTIASYLIGVFIFATIVGQVGNVITNRNASRLEFERLLDSAKLYMRHHKVPRNMQRRVQRWYDYSWSRGRIQGGGDINSALRILPDKLKTELALHVNLLTLKKVSIFQECQPEFLHDLVLKMKASIFTPGDMICRRGEVAREMFIIADGILEVISEHGKVLTTMKAGDFFGEIGILNLDGYNKRTADVRSVGFSELFSLSREDVLSAMKDYPEAQDILQTLGLKRLMEARKAASQYRANQIAARKAKNRGPAECNDESGTSRKLADRLLSDVKGIRQALRRSHRSSKTNDEEHERRPLNSHKATHTSKSSSLVSQRGLLRRMQRVTSDDDHMTTTLDVNARHKERDELASDDTAEVIGAGLPLMQRLKLLKQKEDREALPPSHTPHVQVHAVSSESVPLLKSAGVPVPIAGEASHLPEPIGAGLPLLQRLKLLKQKDELEKKSNAPIPSNLPPPQAIHTHNTSSKECGKHTKDGQGADQDSSGRLLLRPTLPFHQCSEVKEETAEDIKEIEQESIPLLPPSSGASKEERRVGFKDQKHSYTSLGAMGSTPPTTLHDDVTSHHSNSNLHENGATRGGKWRRRLSHKGREALAKARGRNRWSLSASKSNLHEEPHPLAPNHKSNGRPSESMLPLSFLSQPKGASSTDLRVPRCNSEGGIFHAYRRQQTVPVVTDVESVLTDVFNHVLSPASPSAFNALALSPSTTHHPNGNRRTKTVTLRSSSDGRVQHQETSFILDDRTNESITSPESSSLRPHLLRLNHDSRNYVSVDDLSPEFTVLPFVKRLKILNERQKLAELERQLKCSRSFSLDSTDPNAILGEIPGGLVRSQSNSGALETAAFALNDNSHHLEAIPGDQLAESAHFSPSTSPESNETPERRSLKHFLRQLSQGDTRPPWFKAPQQKRQLLRSQTVEGYAARHAQFTIGGRYTSYKETLSSPPTPQPQPLPLITDTSDEEGKADKRPSSPKLSALTDHAVVIPAENNSCDSPPLKPPPLWKSLGSNGNKEGIILGHEEECVTDLLLGIKQVLQTRLEEIQNRFQERIEFLEAEVQRRDSTIHQLREQLRTLTQHRSSVTSPPSTRTIMEDISAEEADAESEASSTDSDENPSHFFMRNHSRDSIIHYSPTADDEVGQHNDSVATVTDSLAWDEFSEDEYQESQRLPSPNLHPNPVSVSTSTSPVSAQDQEEAMLELEFGSAWTRLRSDTVISVEASQSSDEYDEDERYNTVGAHQPGTYPVSRNRKPSLKKRLQKAFSSDFAGFHRQRNQLRVCKSLSPSSENQSEPSAPSRNPFRSLLESRPGPGTAASQSHRQGKFFSRLRNSDSVP